MKCQLINTPLEKYNALKQVLYNRGIAEKDFSHYMHLSDKDINSPELLGQEALAAGAIAVSQAIIHDVQTVIIVDADTDGFTSAALLYNYLQHEFPKWVEQHLHWALHEGKTHGLQDQIQNILDNKYGLVICPDSSSNDYEYHKLLKEKGITVLVLDHHLADKVSENAIVINNQLSDYPNKELSGVGVTWQFCRYLDKKIFVNYANELLDLVALGNCADMQSLQSFETRYLITKGFEKKNIKNPFIEYIIDKNEFPLSKAEYKSYQLLNEDSLITCMGAAFFIVPFVNAITRSGTLEQKQLIFKSMLNNFAFTKVPEIKYNKQTGKEEYLVLKAMRIIGNVKNRQAKMEEAGLALLQKRIEQNNMLQHKALLFLLQNNEIESEIRGLISNKFMAKYQKPCLILTLNEREALYEGSMRGYTKSGISSFKNVLEQCPQVAYVYGHDNAAGVGIYADRAQEFLDQLDEQLAAVPAESVYRIDYDFDEKDIDKEKILQIGGMNDLWGQDFDRAFVCVTFKVTDNNFAVMKSNTFKFALPHDVTAIKFNGTEEQISKFTTKGYVEIKAYCECLINEWNGQHYPQLIIKDYEIIDSSNYYF